MGSYNLCAGIAMRPIILALISSVTAYGQTYTISTVAGGGLPVSVPGTSARLAPQAVALDRAGNVFFTNEDTVLRLDATTGTLTLIAGNGTYGFSGDNGPATSAAVVLPPGARRGLRRQPVHRRHR